MVLRNIPLFSLNLLHSLDPFSTIRIRLPSLLVFNIVPCQSYFFRYFRQLYPAAVESILRAANLQSNRINPLVETTFQRELKLPGRTSS